MSSPKIAYICFDVVPAPKGAAVHIGAFAKALGTSAATVQLVTVSPTPEVIQIPELWPGVAQIALPALGKTLIDRVLYFRQQLWQWLQGQWFEAIQFRSPYEGFPIALHKQQFCRVCLFEVNGLPSVELKYRYPKVADDRELLQKLVAQERLCLQVADAIVTPSSVTRNYLITQGVAAPKIQVIPNGVDLATHTYHPPRHDDELNPFRLIYFGTLSAWQGVELAVEALALYSRDCDATLTVVGPARPGQLPALEKLARKLNVADRLCILEPMPQPELAQHLHKADAIAAPLTANDRNLVQGCCPLKVLEGMASGTPVITSDLPVVQELGTHWMHFLAVQPGSAKAIKDAMLLLRNQPDLRQCLSQTARSHIEQHYTWEHASQRLLKTYRKLGVDLGAPLTPNPGARVLFDG